MNIELLQQLCEASAVSGDEQEVRTLLINALDSSVDEITFDGLGSFVARKGNRGPKVAIVGHMDEVGFMVTHIDESGFLRFTTIGGWWSQSMLNHRVAIRTRKGVPVDPFVIFVPVPLIQQIGLVERCCVALHVEIRINSLLRRRRDQ